MERSGQEFSVVLLFDHKPFIQICTAIHFFLFLSIFNISCSLFNISPTRILILNTGLGRISADAGIASEDAPLEQLSPDFYRLENVNTIFVLFYESYLNIE